MKISTKSWHFWLYKYGGGFPRDAMNLCQYFWVIVAGVIRLLLLVGALLTIIMVAGLFVCILTAMFLKHRPMFFGIVFGGPITYVILRGIDQFIELRKMTRDLQQEAPPSLIMSYIRAKKARVCPMIEFVK